MSPAPRSLALTRPPTDDDLSRAYWELARRGASATGARRAWPYAPRTDEELLAIVAELARHDARLLGIAVELVLLHWRTLNPVALREAMRRMRWPQALCVIVEFAREASPDRELGHWARHVLADWPRVTPAAHFFVDDVRPGERTAARRAGRTLAPYSRWGFLAIERPTIDPHRKTQVGRYDTATRRDILDALLARSPDGVSLAEYLDAIDRTIARQRAIIDLRAAGLHAEGHGRGARWLPASA
jgi:hypothetical protein